MKNKVWCALFLVFVAATSLPGQNFYRFKADFSIKEKETGKEQGRLITGAVYFDKNLRKITYDIRFPAPEQWLIRDTLMYLVRADTLASERTVAPVGEFSIFNMILSQQLTDFGLAKVGFTPGEVQQDGEQVVSTWLPPQHLKQYLGPVTLSLKGKQLSAAAFYGQDGKVGSKFYLQDYTVQGGLSVPGKIYQIFYRPEGEFVRIMTFKNVVINQTDEDNRYDFSLPDGE